MSVLRKSSVIVLAVLGAFALAACDNTFRGVRQDIQDTGDAIGGN